MNDSGRGKAKRPLCAPPVWRRMTWTAGILALGGAASLPAASAQAQYLGGLWAPDYIGGPPPVPPRDVGHHASWHPAPAAVVPPAMEAPPLPLAAFRRRADLAGLRLLGTPHRQGHVYIGFGADSNGRLHHLAFNAYEGVLVENEDAGIAAKPAPAAPPAAVTPPVHQATPATAASPAPDNKPTAAASTAPDNKPAAAAATATATELSPIKPQPGVKHTPATPDKVIDKD